MSTLHQARRVALRRLGAIGLGGSLSLAAPELLLAQALNPVPGVLETNRVRAAPSTWIGRPCLAVELSDEAQARARVTGGNGPSYAIVHRDFTDGVIEVDIAAELTGKGGTDARGFAGIAFHISADLNSAYEAVYLRMTNGR
ncbi:MAG TPA: hypothetical protein VIF38_10770, partial [Burkholderiales bacterium]